MLQNSPKWVFLNFSSWTWDIYLVVWSLCVSFVPTWRQMCSAVVLSGADCVTEKCSLGS